MLHARIKLLDITMRSMHPIKPRDFPHVTRVHRDYCYQQLQGRVRAAFEFMHEKQFEELESNQF